MPYRGSPSVYVGSLDSPASTFLMQADSAPVYSQGYLLFLHGYTLMAQAFDAGKLKLSGQAVSVAEPVEGQSLVALGDFSASDDGTLVYQACERSNREELGLVRSLGQAGRHRGRRGPGRHFLRTERASP